MRATFEFSRAQLTRPVARVVDGQALVMRDAAPAQAFARRYGHAGIVQLVQVDRQFGKLSGPAIERVLCRAFVLY